MKQEAQADPANPLVAIRGGVATTTTLDVAAGTGVQHKNVLELAKTYLSDLEEFGRVAFETRPFETAGGTQTREIAILNEQQATLLLTYMRNSDVVRAFKKRLVREFYRMAEALRGDAASSKPKATGGPNIDVPALASTFESSYRVLTEIICLPHSQAVIAADRAGLADHGASLLKLTGVAEDFKASP
jgi:phage regulator Rha-like protein